MNNNIDNKRNLEVDNIFKNKLIEENDPVFQQKIPIYLSKVQNLKLKCLEVRKIDLSKEQVFEKNSFAMERTTWNLRSPDCLSDDISSLIMKLTAKRNQVVENLDSDMQDLFTKTRNYEGQSMQEKYIDKCRKRKLVTRFFNLEALRSNLVNLKLSNDLSFLGSTLLSKEALGLANYCC